jgi:pimeloyl-ACP methyl ester carboxylesterase
MDPPETLEAGGYTYGRAFLLETQRLNIKEACASYNGPVLILHGDRDYIAPLIFSQEAEQVFPDCTLRVVPGGSHGFWGYQETQALNDMVEFFTAQISES